MNGPLTRAGIYSVRSARAQNRQTALPRRERDWASGGAVEEEARGTPSTGAAQDCSNSLWAAPDPSSSRTVTRSRPPARRATLDHPQLDRFSSRFETLNVSCRSFRRPFPRSSGSDRAMRTDQASGARKRSCGARRTAGRPPSALDIDGPFAFLFGADAERTVMAPSHAGAGQLSNPYG
ncbi:hypothetical protein BJY59DRAFT_225724 [Rhodotorula toruloides]